MWVNPSYAGYGTVALCGELFMGESVSVTLTDLGPGPSKERVSRLLAKVFPNQTKKRVAESLDGLPLLIAPALSPQDGELLARHIRARGGDVALRGVEVEHSPGYGVASGEQGVAFGSIEALSQSGSPGPASTLPPSEPKGVQFGGAAMDAEPEPSWGTSELESGSSWAPSEPEDEPSWSAQEVSEPEADDLDYMPGGTVGDAPEPSFLSAAGGISIHDEPEAKPAKAIEVPAPTVPEIQGTTILREVPNIDRDSGPRGVAPKGSPEAPWEPSAASSKAPWEEEQASKTGLTRLFKGLLKR